MACVLLVVFAVLAVAHAQKPNKPPTYQMNMSTIIMPCNYSGFTDPKTTVGWAIIDFDWSNGKQIWARNHPMNDEELLQQQVGVPCRAGYRAALDTVPRETAGGDVHLGVPRADSVGVPRLDVGISLVRPLHITTKKPRTRKCARARRYTSVRVILEDPKYQDWFVSFKPGGSKPDGTWYSEQCDANLKSVCSDRYHNQEQSPGYPHGDGDCEAPGCDCGKVPLALFVLLLVIMCVCVRVLACTRTAAEGAVRFLLFQPLVHDDRQRPVVRRLV
jgi:hypothetical protein